jgi:hypothetical protein
MLGLLISLSLYIYICVCVCVNVCCVSERQQFKSSRSILQLSSPTRSTSITPFLTQVVKWVAAHNLQSLLGPL